MADRRARPPDVRGIASATLVFCALQGSAAAPVEELTPVEQARAEVRQQSSSEYAQERDGRDDGDGGIGALYYQLQILEDDVRRLQGIVEEQNYRIERLTQEQRERYIELDRRLVELDAPPAGDHSGSVPSVSDDGSFAVPTEQSAYNAAYGIVRDAGGLTPSERRAAYMEALTLFDRLIANYPDSRFVANAYYWIGEIRLYTDEPELARQAFMQVITLYGDHAKVPDALYKLGVVYHRLGENNRALQYLDRVTAEHPAHAAASLAQSYAAELR